VYWETKFVVDDIRTSTLEPTVSHPRLVEGERETERQRERERESEPREEWK
jgi:hypothetical protein